MSDKLDPLQDLLNYAEHHKWCEVYGPKSRCSCGLHSVVDKARLFFGNISQKAALAKTDLPLNIVLSLTFNGNIIQIVEISPSQFIVDFWPHHSTGKSHEAQVVGEDFYPDLKSAWAAVFDFVAEMMK